MAAACPANTRLSTLQAAISRVWRMVVLMPITCSLNSSTISAGTQGAPRRAVMSDGRRSGGCTRVRASTLRPYRGSFPAAAWAFASLPRTAPDK